MRGSLLLMLAKLAYSPELRVCDGLAVSKRDFTVAILQDKVNFQLLHRDTAPMSTDMPSTLSLPPMMRWPNSVKFGVTLEEFGDLETLYISSGPDSIGKTSPRAEPSTN